MKVLLYLFTQSRPARDQVTHLAAHALMDREKHDGPEIERRVVAYPGVEIDDVVSEVGDPITAFAQPRLDPPVQHLPQRRHADHSCDVAILDRP